MAHITIIVGTVMGTALEVANAVQTQLDEAGHSTRIVTAFTPADLVEPPDQVLLLCTSNTGMGDLPQNILPFYIHLTSAYPRLAGRRYGLINLGDSSYPSFGEAGFALDAAMADLGAVPVGAPLVIDAVLVRDPVAPALAWAQIWMALL